MSDDKPILPNKRNIRSGKFAADLKISRLRQKWSITDVAAFLGLSRNTYSNYETGASCPDLYDALALCKLLGLNPWHYYQNNETEK